MSTTEEEWYRMMVRDFYRSPGKHGLVVGVTGSGKTQVLYDILSSIRTFNPQEKIIWLDTGKSSEILTLAKIAPITVFHPIGYKFSVTDHNLPHHHIKVKPFSMDNCINVLYNIDPERINILSIRPFYPNPDEYVGALNTFLKALIDACYAYGLLDKQILPLALFVDEMQYVAPAQGHSLGDAHTAAAVQFEYNVDQLRSFKVRIVGGSQNWTRIRRGVRNAFQWIWIKRGARFTMSDYKKLELANSLWTHLKNDECIVMSEYGHYSNFKFKFPFYGDGEKYGFVRYLKVPAVSEPSAGYSTQQSQPQPEEGQLIKP